LAALVAFASDLGRAACGHIVLYPQRACSYAAVSRPLPDGILALIGKRFFRLYPPVVVAVLLSAALCALIQPHAIDSLSAWFNADSWSAPLSVSLVTDHLLLRCQVFTLDNPLWSIVPEVIVSAMLPAIIYFARASPAVPLLVGAVLYCLASRSGVPGPDAGFSYAYAASRFMLFFVIGVFLATRINAIAERARQVHPRIRLSLWTGPMALTALPDKVIGADLAAGSAASRMQ
jgi:peptidoglycan/LPS O-acetylase OafA/YrhL